MNFKDKVDSFFAKSVEEFDLSLSEAGTVSTPAAAGSTGVARNKKVVGDIATRDELEVDENTDVDELNPTEGETDEDEAKNNTLKDD
jgi:hypothetical protein